MKLISQTCECGITLMVSVKEIGVEYWTSQAVRVHICECGREFRKLEEYLIRNEGVTK